MFPVRIVPDIEEKARKASENRKSSPQVDKDLYDHEVYLKALRESFSPVMARMEAGVDAKTVRRWRRTYIEFVKEYNSVLDEMGEQLVGSVMQRAMGYYVQATEEDPKTGNSIPMWLDTAQTIPKLVTDPMGNPVIQGGNDKLAIKMLEAIYPDKFGQKLSLQTPDIKPFQLTVAPPSKAVKKTDA